MTSTAFAVFTIYPEAREEKAILKGIRRNTPRIMGHNLLNMKTLPWIRSLHFSRKGLGWPLVLGFLEA